MRYKIITTKYGKPMYVFAFEDEEEKNSYFEYWENIIAKSLPQTKDWVQEFTALLQKLKARTDNKYETEDYPYSGRLYSDETLTLIYCQQMIILEYREYLNKSDEQYDKLDELYDRLENSYNQLEKQYNRQKELNDRLLNLYNQLEKQYNRQKEYCNEYKKLVKDWEDLGEKWKNLYFEVKNYEIQPIPDKALAEGRPAEP